MIEAGPGSVKWPVVGMYSFQTTDPIALATFWGQLMGLPLAEGASDEFAMLDFHHERGAVTWMFEQADRLDDSSHGRVGLDLSLADEELWATVADRAQDLGAVRVSEHEESGVRWIAMRDPDGNPFRVFAPRPQ
ncbi:VOC family protein [Brevibacterium yomogidense]|uniref:VOC family protein n=1 Tax=Brevibacterium yomogidense TaxID=946573 RepID=UPI0018E02728|nr:VOC family protein [Brevibacterium yomogidense]